MSILIKSPMIIRIFFVFAFQNLHFHNILYICKGISCYTSKMCFKEPCNLDRMRYLWVIDVYTSNKIVFFVSPFILDYIFFEETLLFENTMNVKGYNLNFLGTRNELRYTLVGNNITIKSISFLYLFVYLKCVCVYECVYM